MRNLSSYSLSILFIFIFPLTPLAQSAAKNTLQRGEILHATEVLQNGDFVLSIALDGNISIRNQITNVVTWSLGAIGQGNNCQLRMNTDGNLCANRADGGFVWCSMNFGDKTVLERDGRLVQYDALGNEIWASFQPIDFKKGIIRHGQSMTLGDQLFSEDGSHVLLIEPSSELAIKEVETGATKWVLGTAGLGPDPKLSLSYIGGNLCYQKPDFQGWCSMVFGNKVVLENDGRLVQYNPDGKEIWSSFQPIKNATIRRGQSMTDGDQLFSNNGKYFLTVEHNGDLVISDNTNGQEVWSLGTKGMGPGVKLSLQNLDGNFCFSNPTTRQGWCSMKFGEKVVLGDDGRLVQYDGAGNEIWASVPPIFISAPPSTPKPTPVTNTPSEVRTYNMGDRVCIVKNGEQRNAMVIGGPGFGANYTGYMVSFSDTREEVVMEPEELPAKGRCVVDPASYNVSPVSADPATLNMNTLEQQIIQEVNRMRADPFAYAVEMDKLAFIDYGPNGAEGSKVYVGNDRLWSCYDEACKTKYMAKVNEAIADLKSIPGPLSQVRENVKINVGAEMLAADAGEINGQQHRDSKGRSVFCRAQTAGYMNRVGECLGNGKTTARAFVTAFLISRGHRKILIDGTYEEIGVDTHFFPEGTSGYIRNVIIMGDPDYSSGPGACNN